jgi:hypothetical protein
MKTAESLQILYEIVERLYGPLEAKKFVTGSLYTVISELQEERLPITGEAIEERLAKVANDFISVSNPENGSA